MCPSKIHLTILLHLLNAAACISQKVKWINGNSKEAQEIKTQFSSDIDNEILSVFQTTPGESKFEKYANFGFRFVKDTKEVLHVFVFTSQDGTKNVAVLLRSKELIPAKQTVEPPARGFTTCRFVTAISRRIFTTPNSTYKKISICKTDVHSNIGDILRKSMIQFQYILAGRLSLMEDAVDHEEFKNPGKRSIMSQIKNRLLKCTSFESVNYKKVELMGKLSLRNIQLPEKRIILLCQLKMSTEGDTTAIYVTAIFDVSDNRQRATLEALGRPAMLLDATQEVQMRLSWIPIHSNRIPDTVKAYGEDKEVKDAIQNAIQMVERNRANIMQYKSKEAKEAFKNKKIADKAVTVQGNITHYCTYKKEKGSSQLVQAYLYILESPENGFLVVLEPQVVETGKARNIVVSQTCSDDEFILSLSRAALRELFAMGSPQQAMIWQVEPFIGGLALERFPTQQLLDAFWKETKAEEQVNFQLSVALSRTVTCVRHEYGLMGDKQDGYPFISFTLTLPRPHDLRYVVFKIVENDNSTSFNLEMVPFLFHKLKNGAERSLWFDTNPE